MRIACLQFAPQLEQVDENIKRADAVLEQDTKSGEEQQRRRTFDLLVLPELAFSGYNFESLSQIRPHLEVAGDGVTAAWARKAALRYEAVVVVGYPEKVEQNSGRPAADAEYYNAAVIADAGGEVVGNYRKSHLYYTDERWALEGRGGFYKGNVSGLGRMVMGICMDINPYKFEASWEAYEFANYVVDTNVRLVVMSMAWCTNTPRDEFFSGSGGEPDTETLLYWIARLLPVTELSSEEETIVVFGNRCGVEGDVTYVGTSAVIGIKQGKVLIYGILGRDEQGLLVVDTDDGPCAEMEMEMPNWMEPMEERR